MRVSGLASGIDVDSIVKSMMTAKRAPLDKLNQQKQILQWTRDSYREINSKLVDFRVNKIADNYRKSAAMNSFKSTVTGNTTAIKVVANADANQVPMKITEATMATQTTLEGQTKVSSSTILDPGTTFTYSERGVSIPPEPIKSKAGQTVESFLKEISNKTGANAVLDEATGKITITSKKFGNEGISFGGSFVTKEMGIDDTDPGDALKAGSNASVMINGVKHWPSSNTLTMNGVQITLLENIKDTDPPVTITTQVDGDKTLSTIKSFINDYNELLDVMNKKTGEEKYRTFAPLTAEQKKDMSDDDVKRWEEKAMSGLLKNDPILNDAISKMREAITSVVGDLKAFGINTGQWFDGGKLYIEDEEKLKLAIENNPQKIIDIFQAPSKSEKPGILNQIYNSLEGVLEKLSEKAGTIKNSSDLKVAFKTESMMGRLLKDYDKRIDALNLRLTNLETRYYKQFTAMETAINKYNQQSTSLSSYFS